MQKLAQLVHHLTVLVGKEPKCPGAVQLEDEGGLLTGWHPGAGQSSSLWKLSLMGPLPG